MAKGKNDKGFLTWLFAIISLILGIGQAIAIITSVSVSGSEIVAIIVSIIMAILAIYFIWTSVMIIIGKASNSWLYVVMAFICAAIIGGILMLIAKLID